MKKAKRRLLPHEKALFGLKLFALACSVLFFVLYAVYKYQWAHCAAWMGISAAQIVSSGIRREEQTKMKIFGIWSFGILFVLFGAVLVWSIM